MLYTDLTETSAPFRLVPHGDRWITICAECEKVAVVHMGEERPREFMLRSSKKLHASWCGSHDAEICTQQISDERGEFSRRDAAANAAGYTGVNVYSGSCARCRAQVPALSGGFLRERPQGVSVYHLDPEFCRAEVARMALIRTLVTPPQPPPPQHPPPPLPTPRTSPPLPLPTPPTPEHENGPERSRAELLELD